MDPDKVAMAPPPVIDPFLMAHLEALRPILVDQGSITKRGDRGTWRLRFRLPADTGHRTNHSLVLGSTEVADAVRRLLAEWREQAAREETRGRNEVAQEQLQALMDSLALKLVAKTVEAAPQKSRAIRVGAGGALW